MFTEATFNNSLKNDASKKKDKSKKKDSKKSSKADDEDEEEDYLSLSDEEKDARDYQLQRAMDMVRALSKIGKKNLEKKDDTDSKKEDVKKENKTETKKDNKSKK